MEHANEQHASEAGGTVSRVRRRGLVVLPLAIFLVLAGAFALALRTGDPARLPSALIGKPAPAFVLPAIEGLLRGGQPVPGLSDTDLRTGGPTIVNVWASWCAPCREEQPLLGRLAATAQVPLLGIDYKDAPDNARAFLDELGNPFRAIGADRNGRVSIDWGVYGVPETYVVDGSGRIVHKYVGPLTEAVIAGEILPAIEKARRPAP